MILRQPSLNPFPRVDSENPIKEEDVPVSTEDNDNDEDYVLVEESAQEFKREENDHDDTSSQASGDNNEDIELFTTAPIAFLDECEKIDIFEPAFQDIEDKVESKIPKDDLWKYFNGLPTDLTVIGTTKDSLILSQTDQWVTIGIDQDPDESKENKDCQIDLKLFKRDPNTAIIGELGHNNEWHFNELTEAEYKKECKSVTRFKTENTAKNVGLGLVSAGLSLTFGLNAGAAFAGISLSTLSLETISALSVSAKIWGSLAFASSMWVNTRTNYTLLPQVIPASWRKLRYFHHNPVRNGLTLTLAASTATSSAILGYEAAGYANAAPTVVVIFMNRFWGTDNFFTATKEWYVENRNNLFGSINKPNLAFAVFFATPLGLVFPQKLNVGLNTITAGRYVQHVPEWVRGIINTGLSFATPALYSSTFVTSWSSAKKSFYATKAKADAASTLSGKVVAWTPPVIDLAASGLSGAAGKNMASGVRGLDGFIARSIFLKDTIQADIFDGVAAASVAIVNATIVAKQFYTKPTKVSGQRFFKELPSSAGEPNSIYQPESKGDSPVTNSITIESLGEQPSDLNFDISPLSQSSFTTPKNLAISPGDDKEQPLLSPSCRR